MLYWRTTKRIGWQNLADGNHIVRRTTYGIVDLAGLVDWAGTVLANTGLDNPRHEARLIVGYGLGITFEQTLRDESCRVTEADLSCVLPLICRRVDREPLAHITGIMEFWSLDFGVGAECLTPRPDSECVVESALVVLRDGEAEPYVLDLGTGSGCLLLSVLHEFSEARGIGVDRSYKTVQRAHLNSCLLSLNDRADFVVGDWGASLKHRFDLILCNPPYVRARDIGDLMPEVSRYEPRLALDGGYDGLSSFRAIAPQLSRLLVPSGVACIEVGAGQAASVVKLFGEHGLKLHSQRADLAGVERCLMFERLLAI